MTDRDWHVVEVTKAAGAVPLVVVCEHASRAIPAELESLGLDDAGSRAHVAWDIGAAVLARALSERLDAPLVSAALSRLVYDCNRAGGARGAVAVRSEAFDVPGNRDLDAGALRQRFARVHVPFHAAVAETCARQTERCGAPVALVTIHSFTPVYLGVRRGVEIGFLHDADPTLAEAMLAAETARGVYRTALNEPYAASDGVTHTMDLHGTTAGRRAAMVEVRNDLIDTDAKAARMGDHLAATLATVLALQVAA